MRYLAPFWFFSLEVCPQRHTIEMVPNDTHLKEPHKNVPYRVKATVSNNFLCTAFYFMSQMTRDHSHLVFVCPFTTFTHHSVPSQPQLEFSLW